MPLRGHTFSYHIQCITAHISVLSAQTPEAHESELHKNQQEVISYIHALQSCLLLAQRLQKDIEERIKMEESKITIDMLDQAASSSGGSGHDANDVVFIPFVTESRMENGQQAENSLIISSDIDSNASNSTIESILSNSSRHSNGNTNNTGANATRNPNASPSASSSTSLGGTRTGQHGHHSSVSSTSTTHSGGVPVDAPPSPHRPMMAAPSVAPVQQQQLTQSRLYRAMSGSGLPTGGRILSHSQATTSGPSYGISTTNVNQVGPVSSVAEEIFLPHNDPTLQQSLQQSHLISQQQQQQQQQPPIISNPTSQQALQQSLHMPPTQDPSRSTPGSQIDLDELLQQPLKPVHPISVKVEDVPQQGSTSGSTTGSTTTSSHIDRTPTNRGLLVLDELLNDSSSSSPQSAMERPREMLSFSSPEQQEKEKILNLFSSFESGSGSNQSQSSQQSQHSHKSFPHQSFPNL